MNYYYLLLTASYAGYTYLIWNLSGKKGGPDLSDKYKWVKENKKLIGAGAIGICVVISGVLYKPLVKTIACQYKGYEHSVETRRDWISGVCSYKNKDGAWIPINRLLGSPEGTDNVNDNNGVQDK